MKYSKLMEDLREKMVSGEIQAGDRLPSENELSAQYQVSRQTVRKALSVLQNEGYIYAEHGRGTFCSERVLHTGHSHNIAVVTTYLSDYIFPRVIGGIDKVLTGLQHHSEKHKEFQKPGGKMLRRASSEGH